MRSTTAPDMNEQAYYTLCQSTEARDILVGHDVGVGAWYLYEDVLFVSDGDLLPQFGSVFIPDLDYITNAICHELGDVKWATMLGRLTAWISNRDDAQNLLAADMKEVLLRFLIHLKTVK